MLAKIKINTSLLICFTFVFRLLFVNASFAANSYSQFTSSNLSTAIVVKFDKSTKSFNTIKNAGNSILEICENDTNDDDKFKTKAFYLTNTFFSLVTDSIINTTQTIIPLDNLLSNTLFNRNIAFQVFRI